jgi:lysophospholipase L1-like esterase
VVVANAFNQHPGGVQEYLKENTGQLCEKFDWNSYVHTVNPFSAFIQKLVELDGLMPAEEWGGFHSFYHKLKWPAKYLTNCEGAHPTVEGYKVIGQHLAEFIKLKNYA